MTTPIGYGIGPLDATDTEALRAFYNGLSPESIRVFRPLGARASIGRCREVVSAGSHEPATRVDWVCSPRGDRTVVGWVFIERLGDPDPELGLGVADLLQGRGIGAALLSEAVQGARALGLREVCLIVVQDNHRAIRLYQGAGFVTTGDELDEHDGLAYFRMRLRL